MNYSIILLGATISVSLFIRICVMCGAMEVSSIGNKELDATLWEIADHDDFVYGWLAHDPTFYFKNTFKKILMPDNVYIEKWRRDVLESLIGQMAQDLHEEKFQISSVKSSKQQDLEIGDDEEIMDEEYYQEHICGVQPNGSHYDGVVIDIFPEGEGVPPGCVYNDPEKRTHLICNDTELTQVPPLPPNLEKLDFSLTKIKNISNSDFGDVSIKNIRFFQNDIQDIVPSAFMRVKNLTSLQIMDNQLKYLAFELYGGLTQVKILILDRNRISYDIYENCTIRDEEDIRIVLPELNYFTLNNNPLKTIPQQMWAGLRNSPVNHLSLASCQLEYIHEESFKYLTKLELLELSDNPKLMPSLSTAFKGLKGINIHILGLGNNNLETFPNEALSIISDSLLTLDLNNNRFSSITKSSVTTTLPKLESLNLSNCKITFIDPGTLELMPNLSKLDLNNNNLLRLPASISSLSKLVYLNLDNNPTDKNEVGNVNPTFYIPPGSFKNLKVLQHLTLNDVPIKTLETDTFAGLENLARLFMQNARIEHIEDGSFKDLKNLNLLLLKNNPLTSINSLTFYGLEKLTNLEMNDCDISFPRPIQDSSTTTVNINVETLEESSNDLKQEIIGDPTSPFKFLPALQWLELQNNSIKYLQPGLFLNNPNLTTIDLSYNNVESWYDSLFGPNKENNTKPTYKKFLVAKNNLGNISDAMLQDIIRFQVNTIDLTQNSFWCNKGACNLRDLIIPKNNSDEARLLPLYVNWNNLDEYICSDPATQMKYEIVEVTDKVCESFEEALGSNQTDAPLGILGSGGSSVVTIAVSVVCVTAFIAAATIFAYKKRVHLKYMWFDVKFNVFPAKSESPIIEAVQYDYDVFVSYHNGDRDFIQDQFLPEVEESVISCKEGDIEEGKGFRVCLHERDFEAGMPITDNIMEAVDRSRKIVIVVSKKYLQSQWCTFEMNLAYHRLIESRRKAFVLILLEEIPSDLKTKVLNYLMRSRTYLEWPGDDASVQEVKRFWFRLRNSFQDSENVSINVSVC